MEIYGSMTIMSTTFTSLVSIGNSVEMSNSRRILDFLDIESGRIQYRTNNYITVRVEYSLDNGSTWDILIDETGLVGDGNPHITTWQVLPNLSKVNEVLVRALAIGNGLFTSVNYVELQYR